MKWLLVVMMAPAVAACLVPQDGMIITQSEVVCADVFYLDKGLFVSGENISIDCDGAVLKSWSGGVGIIIENAVNISVKGCRLVNYDAGFKVINSSSVHLEDNHLVRNKIGVRLEKVTGSATYNHDVSLRAAFEVLESSNNVLSLTNKAVYGAYCDDNFCNEDRSAVEKHLAPRFSLNQLQEWFEKKIIGKSVSQLKSALLTGLA